jgi:hypothetical protein
MKLYTEEEVKQMLIKTDMFTPLHIDHIMNETTPIELPSDEDIESEARFYENYNECMDELESEIASGRYGFVDGAKWMRDKIQGGNK